MPPRRSPEELRREFDALLGLCATYQTKMLGIDPGDPVHVENVAKAFLEQLGLNKSLIGMRQAANDCMHSVMEDMSPALRAELDAAMCDQGLAPLSSYMRKYANRYRKVLERSRIRNETEYYLVSSVLNDGDSTMGARERQLLESMVGEFEQSKSKRPRR